MQTAELKLELFRYIDSLETPKLRQVYEFLVVKKHSNTDFWNELNEWQKNDIEQGLLDLEQGKKHDFETVMQKYR